jgi:S1-C subfamily serine protease
MSAARLRAAAMAGAAAMLLAACSSGAGLREATASRPASPAPPAPAASGSATALQAAYIKVVSQVRPSVVQITTPSGLGSGVIYNHAGDIVTNDHVVAGAHTVTVQFVSGAKATGTVVGAFGGDDLAVVKVTGAPAAVLHPAVFDTGPVQAGDIVLAIGNPLAYESSVTSGIISATGRTVAEPQSPPSPGGVIANAIQTSAPINPGNSGGALVNLAGQVVGIPTLAAQDPQIGGAAEGIGFAIPASTVTSIAGQIIRYGKVVNSHRAALGIYAYQATSITGQPTGVAVEKLTPGSPAGRAGIKPGDVITAVSHTPTTTQAQLQSVLAGLKPGQTVPVKIIQPDGRTVTVQVTLGTLPGNT